MQKFMRECPQALKYLLHLQLQAALWSHAHMYLQGHSCRTAEHGCTTSISCHLLQKHVIFWPGLMLPSLGMPIRVQITHHVQYDVFGVNHGCLARPTVKRASCRPGLMLLDESVNIVCR